MSEIFTTDAKAQREAGLENNSNIVAANDITPNTASANAEVEASVAIRYTLPLSTNSNYAGSPAANWLAKVATQIAGGEILLQQYEGQGGSVLVEAQNKLNVAREKLAELEKGTVILIGDDGVELGKLTAALNVPSGFPTNSDLAVTDLPSDIDIMAIGKEF